MWIERTFSTFVRSLNETNSLPIKILKGPRQVGKTSLLAKLGTHDIVYFDDATVRIRAEENPRLFMDQLPNRVILDEGTLAPALFPELKRRVDHQRRHSSELPPLDVWVTGSNQTILQREVRESLAGRASYFSLGSLAINELGSRYSFGTYLLRGGWPQLYVSEGFSETRYLNDLISSFIERDIVSAAGIERKAAFTKCLALTAGRVGQLYNFSDIATNIGVDVTTVQSWIAVLEENAILYRLQPYYNNLNQRLIKSPKFYFEDVALATRLQGWTELQPLLNSPSLGPLVENMAVDEILKFHTNRGEIPRLNFVRSKDKVEVDLLIHLPNQRCVAAEIKTTPVDFTDAQIGMLNSLSLNIVERWTISPLDGMPFARSKVVSFQNIVNELARIWK